MSAFNTLARLALVSASLVLAAAGGQPLAQPRAIDRVVVFGGSLSDTGNAFLWLSDQVNQACGARQSVPPYDTLDDLLVPDGPYARGGHHFTDGATWVEVLARSLAVAGNARPALRAGGVKASNFAAGGARAVPHPCRFNLPDQVAAYMAKFPQTSPQTLVALEIGGNDVRSSRTDGALARFGTLCSRNLRTPRAYSAAMLLATLASAP